MNGCACNPCQIRSDAARSRSEADDDVISLLCMGPPDRTTGPADPALPTGFQPLPRFANGTSLGRSRSQEGWMGPRSDAPPTDTVATPMGRRVAACVALATMAATIVIAVVGLALHPLVIA